MSKWFVATVPISGGAPEFLPDSVEVTSSGSIFTLVSVGDRHQAHLTGKYLGRLDEGQFGTSGRPAVVVCTGSDTALAWLQNKASGHPEYQYMSLANAWQTTAVRAWLKANGMPWVPGEFSLDPGSTYGRPTLPVVWCGQSHDPWAPEEE